MSSTDVEVGSPAVGDQEAVAEDQLRSNFDLSYARTVIFVWMETILLLLQGCVGVLDLQLSFLPVLRSWSVVRGRMVRGRIAWSAAGARW